MSQLYEWHLTGESVLGLAERSNAVGSLIRGLLTSIRDIDQAPQIISNSLPGINGLSAKSSTQSRQSVQRGWSRPLSELAVAYVAGRRLAGQKVDVKDVDPFTFDDSGNLISLDERFDEKKDDIRFSIGAGVMNAVRDFAQGKDSFIENKYGRIVYPYGRPGTITEKGKIAHGEGLLHIVYSRMAKNGKSLNEAVETAIRVGDAIEKGVVARKIRNKLIFQKDGYEGVVAKNWDGNLVVTGYQIQAGVFGGDNLVPPELRTTPLPRKEDVVAALKDWMNNHPTEQNIPQPPTDVNGVEKSFSLANAQDEWVSLAGTDRLAQGWTFTPKGLTPKEIEALSAAIPEKHHIGSEPHGNDVVLASMFPPNWENTLYPRFVKQFNGDEKALERIRRALFLFMGWHSMSPNHFYSTHKTEVLDALNAPPIPEIDRAKEKERFGSLLKKEKDAFSRKQTLQKEIGYPAYRENAEWIKAKEEYETYRKERLSPSQDAKKRQEIIKERDRLWEENKQQFFERYKDDRQSKGRKELDAIAKEYGVKTLDELSSDSDTRFLVSTPRRSIMEIDSQDGTNLQEISELVAEIKGRGAKPRSRQGHFKLSKTTEDLKNILLGEYFTVRTGVVLDHFGKDPDHSLSIEDWVKISEALHNPLVIAKYSFINKAGKRYYPPKAYRIWVESVINGHWAVVGVEVKSPSRNIEVNAVTTAYGDEHISLNPEDVVYSRNNEEGIRTLLGGPNPHEYSELPSTPNILPQSSPEGNGELKKEQTR